jgi:hypothetical protein
MPPALAARMPTEASSTTTHADGGSLSSSAASWKISGCGFPCGRSHQPHTLASSRSGNQSPARLVARADFPCAQTHPGGCARKTFAFLDDEAAARRRPRASSWREPERLGKATNLARLDQLLQAPLFALSVLDGSSVGVGDMEIVERGGRRSGGAAGPTCFLVGPPS